MAMVGQHVGVDIEEFRRIVNQVQRGEKESRQAKKEMVEANLRLVISIAKKYTNRGLQIPRSHPGRQYRPDEGGRQVRIPPRLQVLDLCDLVDPAGDHALDRRPGRTIRIPVHMIETINKMVRTGRQMLHEIGREPTPEELAEKLQMPLERSAR